MKANMMFAITIGLMFMAMPAFANNTAPNIVDMSEPTVYCIDENYSFHFLITWNDADGDAINTTLVEGNFTGTFLNYSEINEGYIQRFNVTIPQGAYLFNVHAMDEHGLWGYAGGFDGIHFESPCEEGGPEHVCMNGEPMGPSEGYPNGKCCYNNITAADWQLVHACINDNCSDTSTVSFDYCDNGCNDATGTCNMPRWQTLLIMALILIPLMIVAWYYGRRH